MTDSDDRYDQLCTKCGMGRYHETSIHDDWDGVLHCTNKKCNHEVKRYKWKDNPPPKPEKVKLSIAAQAVLDAYNSGFDRPVAVHHKPRIAAALQAAADQVVPDIGYEADCLDEPVESELQCIRNRFLAIAAELEAQ